MGIDRFNPNNPHIIVRARLFGPSGVEWVDLILDTGATHTIIDETVAFRLGYDLSSAPTVSLTTVSGTTQASVIAIRQIFALGETVGDFQVLALPLPIQLRADGLLGLDFLRRRNLFCNFHKGILLTLPFADQIWHRIVLSTQIYPHL
jgi:predicted aspartyl protease